MTESESVVDGLASAPIEHDFAGVAGFHQLDGFLELRVGEAVRDDRRDIQAALDHGGHFVPRFIHFAAVNAFDRQLIEYHEIPINRGAGGHDAKERDLSAVKHVWQNIGESFPVAGHFQRDVKAFLHSKLLHCVGHRFSAHVQCEIDPHFAREIETIRIDVCNYDVATAGAFANRNGHATDRSGASNEHVFPD